jgi:hypothetical protein
VDSGVSHCFLSDAFASRARLRLDPSPLSTVTMADAKPSPILGRATVTLRMGAYTDTVTAEVMTAVLPGVDLILGDAWLRRVGATVDYGRTPVLLTVQPYPKARHIHLRPMAGQHGVDPDPFPTELNPKPTGSPPHPAHVATCSAKTLDLGLAHF